jgi:hypothetical protein
MDIPLDIVYSQKSKKYSKKKYNKKLKLGINIAPSGRL